MKNFNKVFCIGFNKTGTSSLNDYFISVGFKSFHGMYSEVVDSGELSHAMFTEYDCFTDGEMHDYRLLDETFPGSKFILNTRRLDKWLMSRIKHVHYRRSVGRTGWMRKEYERNPDMAVRNWISRRQQYYQDVRSYFQDRKDMFLEINVCDVDAQLVVPRLHQFLELAGEPGTEMPRANAHSARLKPRKRDRLLMMLGLKKEFEFDLLEYRQQIDRVFDELGLDPEERVSDG